MSHDPIDDRRRHFGTLAATLSDDVRAVAEGRRQSSSELTAFRDQLRASLASLGEELAEKKA